MNDAIGFVGAGRIARIMLGGWRRADALPGSVVAHDVDPAVLARLKSEYPGTRILDSSSAVAAAADVVFLGLHPPQLGPALPFLRGVLRADTLVVSLAPKRTLAQLTGDLGNHGLVARVLPNAPSLIGAGYNPVAFSPAMAVRDRARLLDLLAPLGDCPEVPEDDIEAYALIAAMGPTYLWFQLQHLRELGAEFGLSDAALQRALPAMAAGAVHTLYHSGLDAAAVMDLIPVRPLGDDEDTIRSLYDERLRALYRKLSNRPEPLPV